MFWWCDFDKLARNILTNFLSEINIPKRYLYKTEATYFSFPMIESKTIKSVENFNSKPPPQEHLRQLVVSDLRSETKGSRSSPAASYVQR